MSIIMSRPIQFIRMLMYHNFSLIKESHVRYAFFTQVCTFRDDKSANIELTIHGQRVSAIEDELTSYIEENHQMYSVNFVEVGYYNLNEFTGKWPGDVQIIKHVLEGNRWVEKKKASCDLIITGTPENTTSKAGALYAVVSAHVVLDTSGCEQMLKADPQKRIEDLVDKLEPQIARYTLRMHSENIEIDLVERPLYCYAHYFSRKDDHKERKLKESGSTHKREKWNPHLSFMKDATIMKLSPAAPPKSIEKILQAIMERVLYSGHSPTSYKVGEILPVYDPAELDTLHKRMIDVKIGGLDGWLYHDPDWLKPTWITEDEQQAYRVVFTTKFQ